MKEILRKAGVVSAFALAAALSSAASATPFSITGAAFTNISTAGYGSETKAVEDSVDATLLNVIFDTSGFLTQNFTLSNVNDTFGLFNFGKVTFNEKDISQKEVDNQNLGVSATFTFAAPGVGAKSVTATGNAVLGVVNDPGNPTLADFTINWNPLTVDFGTTGSFKIEVSQLAFATNNQELAATARVTLLSKDTVVTPPAPVPEPGSLALAGLGLVAVGLVRRSKR